MADIETRNLLLRELFADLKNKFVFLIARVWIYGQLLTTAGLNWGLLLFLGYQLTPIFFRFFNRCFLSFGCVSGFLLIFRQKTSFHFSTLCNLGFSLFVSSRFVPGGLDGPTDWTVTIARQFCTIGPVAARLQKKGRKCGMHSDE